MSLNRNEQRVFDYLQAQPDELRYWREKVRREVAGASDAHALTSALERQLWRYYEERAAVTEPFRSAVRHEGRARTSMRNLAELLLRLWHSPDALPKHTDSPYA